MRSAACRIRSSDWPHLLLEGFGLDGDAFEVLVDIVDVVAPQRLAEFDGPQTVEARLLTTRLRAVHGGILANARRRPFRWTDGPDRRPR